MLKNNQHRWNKSSKDVAAPQEEAPLLSADDTKAADLEAIREFITEMQERYIPLDFDECELEGTVESHLDGNLDENQESPV